MAKKRILVVDDTQDTAESLKRYLAKDGIYEVQVVNLGAKALGVARVFKPDLVLLDVMMPDMDGGEVASQIEHDPSLKNTQIVLLTVVVTKEEERMLGGDIGGRAILSKQTKLEDILTFVNQRLSS